jgi:hypothetical protein
LALFWDVIPYNLIERYNFFVRVAERLVTKRKCWAYDINASFIVGLRMRIISSDGIATRLRDGRLRSRGSVPGRGSDILP